LPLPPARGFLYLAVVLDAWSRRIVGWAFSAWTIERIREDARGPSTRLPASRSACFTQVEIDCAVGSNSRASSSGVRPDMALVARKPDNVVHHSDSQWIRASSWAA
jgi:putative transposase